MPTTIVKTIGTGGDYSTIQAWEDAAPANLVTADQIWQGQCKNQTFSGGALLTVAGSTTDSTHYKHLTTEAGASFRDNGSAASNALRYNASNGAAISGSSPYALYCIDASGEGYFRLSNLQVQTQSALRGIRGTTGSRIENCIFEAAGAQIVSGVEYLANSLFVQRGNDTSMGSWTGDVAMYNCTWVVPSSFTPASNLLNFAYGGTRTAQNCAFFGCTNLQSTLGGGGLTFTTCYTDDTTPPSGCTTVAFDTSTGSGFETITDTGRDFRIKSSSALKDTGTTDSTNAATDIIGTTRPQGPAYDVGCWEFIVGGGGDFTATLAETSSSSDAVSSAMAASVSLAEAASAADVPAAVTARAAALAEAASAADAQAAATSLGGSVAEAASAADAVDAVVSRTGTITESATASDAVNGTTTGDYTANLAEAAAAADAVSSSMAATVALSESALAADTVAAVNNWLAAVVEATSAADTVNGTVGAGGGAIFPDPGDVTIGVVYGPNGNDFVGTKTGGGGSYIRRR